MFCQNCGSQVESDAAFCTKCGADLRRISSTPTTQAQPSAQSPAISNSTATNTIAIVGFILSFFIALAGLVCSIVGLNNAKRGAPYKGLAVAGIIISAISMFLAFIITIATL